MCTLKNYKTVMKETEDYTNKWKDIPLLLDWRNHCCPNDYNTQGNLYIQCNVYQITKSIFHRTGTNFFKIYMKTQKP